MTPLVIGGSGTLRDIKKIDMAPISLRTAASIVMGGLAVIVIVLLASRLEQRRYAAAAVARDPALPGAPAGPYDFALARLAEIAQAWTARGDVEAHYAGTADVLRRYLADAHGVPAPERTTPELLVALPDRLAGQRAARGGERRAGRRGSRQVRAVRARGSGARDVAGDRPLGPVRLGGDAVTPSVTPLVTPFSGMQFADPWAFVLLVVVAADAMRAWPRRDRVPAAHLGFPGVSFLAGEPAAGRVRWLRLPPAMRTLALALLVVALARPRADGLRHDTPVRGRNIVLTLDISSSMKALDFRTGNRIEVAKRVLGDFVARRRGDFLGLVVFAGRAFTQAPLTTDADVVLELLHRADIGLLPDGTAIGTALAMSESHLEDLPRESGVIVLLTDGGNNTGYPDPLAAAEAARALGIRIYAIGVSSRGATPIAPYETGRPATMEAPLDAHQPRGTGPGADRIHQQRQVFPCQRR